MIYNQYTEWKILERKYGNMFILNFTPPIIRKHDQTDVKNWQQSRIMKVFEMLTQN